MSLKNVPYIVCHTTSSLDIKDYDIDHFQKVVDRINDIKIVQVGLKSDKRLKNVIDLCGKTSINETAYIIKYAQAVVCPDSVIGHIAAAVDTPVVVLFGATWANSCAPKKKNADVIIVDVPHRGRVDPCIKACHYSSCNNPSGKCINHIKPQTILDAIASIIGGEYILPEKELTISTYSIIRNGINLDFPIKEVIDSHLAYADEFILVDGYSDDGTWELLQELQKDRPKLKLFQNEWVKKADLMGEQKTFARRQCTGDWLVQTDMDEIMLPWSAGAVRRVIKENPNENILDVPCFTSHKYPDGLSKKENFYKWRISPNKSSIKHGVAAPFREYDTDGNIKFDRAKSDSCEYIWEDSGDIVNGPVLWPKQLYILNHAFKEGRLSLDSDAGQLFKNILIQDYYSNIMPSILHVSWLSHARKLKMDAEFWKDVPRYHEANGKLERKATGKWVEKNNEEIDGAAVATAAEEFDVEDVARLTEIKYPRMLKEYLSKYFDNPEDYLLTEAQEAEFMNGTHRFQKMDVNNKENVTC